MKEDRGKRATQRRLGLKGKAILGPGKSAFTTQSGVACIRHEGRQL